MQLRVSTLGRPHELRENTSAINISCRSDLTSPAPRVERRTLMNHKRSANHASIQRAKPGWLIRVIIMSRHQNPALRLTAISYLRVSPSQRRKVRNGPRPAKRAAAEATLRALFPCVQTVAQRRQCPKCRFTARPGARSSRPVPHAPPSLARSGHPIVCHTARNLAPQCLHLRRGERCASQQHGPRRAPPAPSLLTPVQSARGVAQDHGSTGKKQLSLAT